MQFFKFVDGVVELARPEIALYPTINEILKRDKGGKITGDPDGRKKAFAFKELTYVYYTCDFNAYPTQHGLDKLQAHLYAIKYTGLPEQYEPDPIVRALMVQYIDEHWSVGKKTIKTLIEAFTLSDLALASITSNLKLLLNSASLTPDQITQMIKYQQQILDIAQQVPKQVKQLREAIAIVQEEEREILIRQGGEEVPDSMLPGNKIENEE